MTPQQRQEEKLKRRAARAAKDPKASAVPTPTPPLPPELRDLERRVAFKLKAVEGQIERLRGLDLSTTPTMNEKTKLIRELMALGRERVLHDWDNKVPLEERTSFLHPEVRPKARAICERLHEITKDSDPGFFRWLFDCDMQSFPRLDQRELSRVLDGIGTWLD